MNKDIDLVIAHFTESLCWINRLNQNQILNIYLYTKSDILIDPITFPVSIKQIFLSNIGREAHTYLYHIINNYDKLPDYLFFLQGRPNLNIESINRILCTDKQNQSYYSNNYRSVDEWFLDDKNKILKWKNINLLDTKLSFMDWFSKYIDIKIPKLPYKIYFESNFFISKTYILSRPISYYQNLIKQLPTNNTEAAHFLERSWYYIFNLP